MKKYIICIVMVLLMLSLAGCGDKPAAVSGDNSELTESGVTEADSNEISEDVNSTAAVNNSGDLALPPSYPSEILPMAVDAEIIGIKENPENGSLEVSYVSDNNIGTLCDFHEAALKDAANLSTMEIAGGYIITAEMDGISYNIMISEDAMDPNPEYAGKISVYINLSGL